MITYTCNLCKKNVPKIYATQIRTAVPVPGILEDAHTFENADICQECATEIAFARMVAEVDAFKRLYLQETKETEVADDAR